MAACENQGKLCESSDHSTQNQLKNCFWKKKTENDNKKTKRLTEIHPTKIHEIPHENIPQNQI